MMERLLVAERGDAAVRIARTCKRLGITTVALRASGDSDDAPHVDACDETQPWTDEPAGLIATATACRADAIHPGYAEGQRIELVQAAEDAGVKVVAATSDSLAACRDPERLRAAAEHAGLRLTPPEGLDRARLIEMVLVVDTHRTTAALGEMEVLTDSDGEPLLREAPSPALSMRYDGEAVREAMAEGADRALVHLGVRGVAVAAFWFDVDGRFWLEAVHPGLPSWHAPVEMVAGLDLVEIQLGVTAGEPLAPELFRLQPSGHAFVTRVDATVSTPFEPVTEMRWPPTAHGRARVEPAMQAGAVPENRQLVKIATVGPVRHAALLTLDRVLAATTIAPYDTNVGRLRHVLADESFRAGQYDSSFMRRLLAQDAADD